VTTTTGLLFFAMSTLPWRPAVRFAAKGKRRFRPL
jgi:hypothetical protein